MSSRQPLNCAKRAMHDSKRQNHVYFKKIIKIIVKKPERFWTIKQCYSQGSPQGLQKQDSIPVHQEVLEGHKNTFALGYKAHFQSTGPSCQSTRCRTSSPDRWSKQLVQLSKLDIITVNTVGNVTRRRAPSRFTSKLNFSKSKSHSSKSGAVGQFQKFYFLFRK